MSSPTPDHVARNRANWNATSDGYESLHASALAGDRALAWGLWRIPEAELRILGEVRDRDVLELGCGAARWSLALAAQGARPVGLDLARGQLTHARRLAREARIALPLVEASAEEVPFRDGRFDIVFCDWGAMTFADPRRTVPEVARVLRPGGLLAFATASPLALVCLDRERDRVVPRLINDYFGPGRFDTPDQTEFNLPHGEWIRLFGRHGLVVEDLIEVRPPAGATSTFRSPEETAWARHWPMENTWRVRKRG